MNATSRATLRAALVLHEVSITVTSAPQGQKARAVAFRGSLMALALARVAQLVTTAQRGDRVTVTTTAGGITRTHLDVVFTRGRQTPTGAITLHWSDVTAAPKGARRR